MDSDTKAGVIHSAIWGIVVLLIVGGLVSSVASCTKQEVEQEGILKAECIKAGGNVVPVNNMKFACIRAGDKK